METCNICTQIIEEVSINLPCQHRCCSSCLFSWSIEQIQNAAETPSTIKCFEIDCGVSIPIDILFQNFRNPELQELCDLLTKVALRAADGFISCPKPNCPNIGFRDTSACTNPYSCNKCGHQWHEIDQLSVFSRFKQNLWESLRVAVSKVYIELVCGWCPRCKVQILKDHGCNHMTCSRCGHEFCWLCSHPFPKYNHIPSRICDDQAIAMAMIWSFAIVHIFWHIGGFSTLWKCIIGLTMVSKILMIGSGALLSNFLSFHNEKNIHFVLALFATLAAINTCLTIAWMFLEIEREKKNKPHKKNRKRIKAQRSYLKLLNFKIFKRFLDVGVRMSVIFLLSNFWAMSFVALAMYPLIVWWMVKKGKFNPGSAIQISAVCEHFFNRWDSMFFGAMCLFGLLSWHIVDFNFHLSA